MQKFGNARVKEACFFLNAVPALENICNKCLQFYRVGFFAYLLCLEVKASLLLYAVSE